MARLPVLAALTLLAGIGGFLLAGRDGGPAPRAAPGPRSDPVVEARVVELERRVDALEDRLTTPRRDPEEVQGTPSDPRKGPPVPRTDAATKEDWKEQRETWEKRFREAATATARVAVLRDAGIQLKEHASRATARDLFEGILRTVDPASEEGIFVTFELGHLARGDGDYAKADEFYRRVEGLVPRDSPHAADARFQLAWNRKFTGDAAEAERLFRSVADAAEADPGTRVAAHYAVATLRGDAGDAAGLKAEIERLLVEVKRHPGDGGVAYYADLAKKLLATLD